MNITAADVNKLRQQTGAGMMDCKKALTEANGDFDEAVVVLRKRGQKMSANRMDRDAKEGAVIAMTNPERTHGVVVELNCETDFVGKNEDFVALAERIATLALHQAPANLDALLALDMDGAPLSDRLNEQIAKIGERISVSNYKHMEGTNLVPYIHMGNKLGVLVELSNSPNDANFAAGKDVAMQIAAMNPVAVDKDDVDATVVQREIEIGMDQARQEGKAEGMLEKIAQGKLGRFYKDNTLLNQDFVKDGSKSVSKMLTDVEPGLTVKRFTRVALGASAPVAA